MFGTLMYDLQHKEPTFIENNPEAVINRNRRGKPHIACEYCRARKLRCNGDPNGCDRCKSSSNTCKYPTNRNTVRKRKQSTSSTKEVSKTRQSSFDSSAAPQSPSYSEKFDLGPSLVFTTDQEASEVLTELGNLQRRSILPSPTFDITSISQNETMEETGNAQHAKQEQDQIDHWLASCSLLSPNTTIDVANLKSGDFTGPWQELEKDTAYFDPADDSGEDGISSQETQLDFEMNDGNEVLDDSSSTPGLSSSSLDLLLDENFPSNLMVSPVDQPTSAKIQPSRKSTPVAYNMAAPATSPMTALLEGSDLAVKKKSECRCLRLAAHLLEQLGNEGANTEIATVDVLLNCCREAIKGCDSILSCTLCKSRSESMMLLAMAGQYLSNICEKTVRSYVDVVQKLQSGNSQLTGDSMWFQSYKIESPVEKNQVLKCLVTGQLTEFCQLIGKIKARVGTRKAHLAPLLGAERKIQCMRTMLMQCESYRTNV
ncbi:hypothetical protein CPAR01_04668 [Colletotrichum paranaense]|uniref:Zn(2)-C6 fungal-type domain-containing protein n=1 Tax=Colletotrichum paranaense TaxID=1914294 RepID=A0ABQ9SWZ7_9PEZI|nr:uncharacterized protein CPAR01_04668 [Colletotrichum paranaense]KAK1544035.1 hypothetical protein CPAR01_04668 [Colletotrichum paranaense]